MSNNTILQINSSGRQTDSLTKQWSAKITDKLSHENSQVINRDLNSGLPFVDEGWIGANFTDKEQRTPAQQDKLKTSDQLISELQEADHIVIGAPIYNFSIPAVLKAWIDMVARAQVTFKYSEKGPVGLLTGKKAYIAMASGGVPIGSAMDYASNYLKHVLAFIGITDVTIVDIANSDEHLTQIVGV